MKKLLVLLLLAGCSFLPWGGTPAVENFKYQTFPDNNGWLIAYEVQFNKHTEQVWVDAAAIQDGTSVFRQDCDYFSEHCYLHHYDFRGLNAKENIKVIDGISTNHTGQVDLYFYLHPDNITTRITIETK